MDVILIEKLKWTQEEAISFEAAKDCIGHWIAIHSEQIFDEKNKDFPDLFILKKLTDERSRLCDERREMPFDDPEKIAFIRHYYGALIRDFLRKDS
jgi:hypothetical protein